jgi:hypothetical protein
MAQRSNNNQYIIPVGLQLAKQRKIRAGSYDKKLGGWIDDADGSVVLATYITDPQRKEWDD